GLLFGALDAFAIQATAGCVTMLLRRIRANRRERPAPPAGRRGGSRKPRNLCRRSFDIGRRAEGGKDCRSPRNPYDNRTSANRSYSTPRKTRSPYTPFPDMPPVPGSWRLSATAGRDTLRE